MSLFSADMQKYKFSDAQKLLIKPSERLQFALLYVFVTIVSYQFVEFLVRYFLGNEDGFSHYSDQVEVVIGLLMGGLTGLSQWFILRKYIPNVQWILIALTYSSLIVILQIFYTREVDELLRMNPNFSRQLPFLAITACAFLYGYAQHYVIAPYIRSFRWWLWIPVSSLVLQFIIFGWAYLSIFLGNAPDATSAASAAFYRDLLRFDYRFLLNAGLAFIQTIGFCYLYKKSSKDKSKDPTSDPNFNLAIAPDLVDIWKIRSIQQTIEQKINKIWKTDLSGNQNLAYFIGVDQSGEIVACIPQTQAAIDRFQDTPLPALVEEPVQELSNVLNQPIAKFHLTFSPPGISKLVSCRGIPRRELFGAIAILLLIISIIIPRLGI
jgi:hypothetical protein